MSEKLEISKAHAEALIQAAGNRGNSVAAKIEELRNPKPAQPAPSNESNDSGAGSADETSTAGGNEGNAGAGNDNTGQSSQ